MLMTDFAYEGFRLIRQRPILILYWGLFYLVCVALSLYVIAYMAGPEAMHMMTLKSEDIMKMDTQEHISQGLAPFSRLWPALFVAIVINSVFNAILGAAILRASLNESDDEFGYLRLGMDEWRQWLAGMGLYLCLFAAMVVIGFVFGIIGGVLSFIPALVAVLSFVAFITFFIVLLGLFMRLSLIWPQSFADKRIDFAKAWKLTSPNNLNRGAVNLFWGYVLAYFLSCLVLILVQVVFSTLIPHTQVKSTNDMFAALQPDLSSTYSLIQINTLIYALSSAVINPLVTAIRLGATAAAYKQISATAQFD